MDANQPGAAVLAIFDQLINTVKQSSPLRSDGKPLNDVVYSMLILGSPVDPQDYVNPWTPQGDIDVKASVAAGTIPTAAAAAPAAGAAAAPPAPDPEAARALAAAYKTSTLCNAMLEVTDDGSYEPYSIGRTLSFAYEGIINAMQPIAPNEAPDPQVTAAIDKARRVLFAVNADGSISTTRSAMYRTYIADTNAYGMAVANFATAFAVAKSDPTQMQVWPVVSLPLQNAVDEAKNQLIADGSQQVEEALDTLASVGNPIEAHMVAQAREIYEQWNLGLTGAVPAKVPYSFVLPTGWADPTDDDEGWQTLTVDSQSYSSYDVQHATSQSQFAWFNKSSSTGGDGGVVLGFAALGGSGGTASSSSGSSGSSRSSASGTIGTDATELTISLEYALCTIERPWLMSDLFYMQGWYLRGGAAKSISTGEIADQANSAKPLLPMIPQQMLVIRNVKISTRKWGSLAKTLKDTYGDGTTDASASSSQEAGSGGVSLGFISFGGSASHAQSQAQGGSASFTATDSQSYFGTTFDGSTLHIPGAQIIAYLSGVVPLCPAVDDPELGKTAPVAATAAAATPATPAATAGAPAAAAH
jgi:hypothetical protein